MNTLKIRVLRKTTWSCRIANASKLQVAMLLIIHLVVFWPQRGSLAQDRVVEKPEPDKRTEEHPSLFDIEVDGKAGFIDKFGKIMIPPVYDKAYPFSEGLAAVEVDGKWGYIDSSGTFAIEPQFAEAAPFSQGRARVRIGSHNDLFGYIDVEANVVIKPQFDCAESFRAGIAKVGKATLAGHMIARIADVGIECVDSYIDLDGNPVAAPKPEYYASQQPGALFPFNEGELFGYVDATGKLVIAAQFLYAEEFSEELAVVCDREMRYGYINVKGAYIIPPKFSRGNAFASGLAGVQFEDGLWGFINRDGETVIPGTYHWVHGGFRDGLASVAYEKRARYIDRDGNWVW